MPSNGKGSRVAAPSPARLPIRRMLTLVDRRWPCDHSFLEGVIARRLPARGYRLLWVMQAAQATRGTRVHRWHGAPVVVLPRGRPGGFMGLVLDRCGLAWRTVMVVYRCLRWQPDLIFVRNEPVYLAVVSLLRRRHRCPIVYQLSHLKEEEMLERARLTKGWRAVWWTLKGVVGRALRDRYLTRCNRVLAISQHMADFLVTKGVAPRRIEVFPMGVDPTDDGEPGRYVIDSGLPYVIYVGTMAPVRKLEVVVRAFLDMSEEQPDWRLMLLGGGHEAEGRARLKQLVAEHAAGWRVVFIPQQPRRRVSQYIRGAHFGLSLVPPVGVLRSISPTKLMEYLREGVPVLASTGIPDQERILAASHAGMLVDFEAMAIKAGLKRMMMLTPAARTTMGDAGRSYVLKHRNYAGEADRLAAVLETEAPAS